MHKNGNKTPQKPLQKVTSGNTVEKPIVTTLKEEFQVEIPKTLNKRAYSGIEKEIPIKLTENPVIT